MDLIFFHPSHVHVPTPTLSSPSNIVRLKKSFYNSSSTLAQRAASLLVNEVVKPLEERGLLAVTRSSGARKWQGVIRVPEKCDGVWEDKGTRISGIQDVKGVFRRADFNLVPIKSRAAGLLALTGDTEFNKDLRTRASKLGMHLNEFGLWRWQTEDVKNEDEQKGFWELIKVESEEEILNELGLEYVEPEKRNFGFVVGKTKTTPKRSGLGKPKKISRLLD